MNLHSYAEIGQHMQMYVMQLDHCKINFNNDTLINKMAAIRRPRRGVFFSFRHKETTTNMRIINLLCIKQGITWFLVRANTYNLFLLLVPEKNKHVRTLKNKV
jgi:hypothetical protein